MPELNVVLDNPESGMTREQDLIAQVQRGHHELFYEIVRPYERRVYAAAMAILRNENDAEDVAQEAMLKALANIRQFRAEARFSTWLIQITVNEALMRLRKRQSERVVGLSEIPGADDEEGGILQMQDVHPDPERQCIATDLAVKAFRGLDASLGNTFILNKAEGWTNRELAKAFGTTAETVKSRIFRTRLKLRQEMLALSQPASVALQA